MIPTIAGIRAAVAQARARSLSVGVVPTMGALHAGHGELIRRARAENGYVVVTLFVNPTQFNNPDDLARYPRTLEADLAYCQSLGVDAVFAPGAEEMYPEGDPLTWVQVARLSERLEGEFRPGHFRGVATVVAKLFNIVAADRAYFGEKDAQQLAVVQRMVADLNFPVTIVPVPTVREPDGLAISSRNRLLSSEDRAVAPQLYRALAAAAEQIRQGCCDAKKARAAALDVLARAPAIRVEYVEVADAASMQPVAWIGGPVRVLGAVWLGTTRLIDNVPVGPG
jgi:pantoate--beta-alanine ligase